MRRKPYVNRRKTKIIMRHLQGRMIRETSLIPLVALTVMAVTVTGLCRSVMADADAALVDLPHLDLLLVTVVCMTSMMVGAILYVAFRFTHRVAGPSYRLIESLKLVEKGEVSFHVRLRKDDFLTEVADQLNKTLAALQQRAGCESDDMPINPPHVENADPAQVEVEVAGSAAGS